MTDVFKLTAEFAERCIDLHAPEQPTRLSEERKLWAHRAIAEELKEFLEANVLEDEVDALCDLIYFAAGRLHEMGVLGGVHFEEVHGANLDKKRGRLEKRSHGLSEEGGFDAVKPDDWEGPNHTGILDLKRGCVGGFRTRMGTVHHSDPRTEADGHYTLHPNLRAMSPLPASRQIERRKPKVLILGHARHGKDTVAEMLRDLYGYSFASSSHFCAERVLLPYFNSLQGHPGYADVHDCYEDRVNHRATWFQQIEAYNTPDRARLAREMLEENDLYVGMRSSKEFEVARGLFDHIVWVDAGKRQPPEPRDSFDIDFHASMWLVRNDGTLDDLKAAVHRLAVILGDAA